MTEWLEYEDLVAEGKDHEHLIHLEAEGKEAPQQPEPLAELRKLRRFNFTHLPWSGGLQNQPHVYMAEIHTCIEAENEHQAFLIAKMRFQSQNGGTK